MFRESRQFAERNRRTADHLMVAPAVLVDGEPGVGSLCRAGLLRCSLLSSRSPWRISW